MSKLTTEDTEEHGVDFQSLIINKKGSVILRSTPW